MRWEAGSGKGGGKVKEEREEKRANEGGARRKVMVGYNVTVEVIKVY